MGEQAVQGAEDRGKTSKRKLKNLRDQYMQQGASNGLCVEDLAQTFNLSEKWVQDGILGGSGRKREKGEEPLTALEINNLKLDFACLMGQQGYTIEQCNYMMNLTAEDDFDKQERQAEQEAKYRELERKNAELERKHKNLESRHEKLKVKANRVLGDLQKQVEGLSQEKADQQAVKEADSAKLQELEELRKQYDLKCSELASSQEEHTKILQELTAQHKAEVDSLKQQQQEKYQRVKAESKAILEKAQSGCGECRKSSDAEIRGLQDKVRLAEDMVKALETENQGLSQELLNLQEEEKQVSSTTGTGATGRKKLTGVQEEQVLSFYKKRKYKVTELSLKKLEKECEIILTKKAVYNLFDRFGIQR